jgi:hypothetical protein
VSRKPNVSSAPRVYPHLSSLHVLTRAQRKLKLLPAALASVPFGFVLVRVRVPEVTSQKHPGRPRSDYASAGSVKVLETLEPQYSLSSPRTLDALKLRGASIRIGAFWLAASLSWRYRSEVVGDGATRRLAGNPSV